MSGVFIVTKPPGGLETRFAECALLVAQYDGGLLEEQQKEKGPRR